MTADPTGDIARAAMAVRSEAELARVLRVLRRREARVRRGAALTYREISDRTGWSVSVIGGYFTGMRLPSAERLDELARLLGASGPELGALASARERAGEERPCDQDRAVPRMLPPRVAGFTGRVRELARLDGLLVDHPPGQAAIRAIEGMGGVGKTALAVHWAHTVADRFPDGQLYVNLRGHDPGEPVSAMDALRALIGGLGVDAVDLPRDVDGRARLYRRLLDGRRVLVLLDNAGAADEVRPLVPPPPSTAVVTSRNELSDLVPVDGGPVDAGRAQPRRGGGPAAPAGGGAGGPGTGRRTGVGAAVRKPPVGVAGGGRARPAAPRRPAGPPRRRTRRDSPRNASRRVRRRRRRPVQRAGRAVVVAATPPRDGAAGVASAGPGSGPGLRRYGVAALAAIPLPEATRLTDALTRAHLVQPLGRGRYSMHDLVRAYAVESAQGALTPDERHASMGRLVDYYLAAATTAVDLQFPMNRSTRPDLAATGPVLTPDLPDVASASAWLGAERESLVQACLYGVRHGWTRRPSRSRSSCGRCWTTALSTMA
jgi:transcriptional regulator with XRE-family HTH domain